MRNYDALLQAGNEAQLEKLREKEGKKGGWDRLSLKDIEIYLLGEILEYAQAAKTGNYKEIRREAADVANFAHMIIEKCNEELKK